MVTKLRLLAVVCAVVGAVVIVVQSAPAGLTGRADVQLRSTFAPMQTPSTTIKYPVIDLTNSRPFEPCQDIPIGVIEGLGLAFTPPDPEEGLRCRYDAGNYQMAVDAITWRTYEESLTPDALELDINGHRAAWVWAMKPTDWNNRWWSSCMITFKTSYGIITQSLYYAPAYSNPDVDCPVENMRRAYELSPHYIF